MPDRMASHWNIRSEVDGYLPKFWGLFLIPLVSLVMFDLFLLIPKIDPLKKNIKKFEKYYYGFILIMIVFLFYTYMLTIEANIGLKFNIGMFLISGMSLLFFYIGVMLENSKRNWFIGIRTPWTLQNDKVWKKTHKLGGKLFKISAITILVGIFLAENIFWFIMVLIFLTVIIPIVYSYIIYKRQKED